MAVRLSKADADRLGLTPGKPGKAKTPKPAVVLPERPGWLVLPWPPSVNKHRAFVRGKMILTKVFRDYQKAVQAVLLPLRYNGLETITERCHVWVDLWPPDERLRDIDNTQKAVLDSIVKCGILADDSLIDKLTIERREVCRECPRVEVKVEVI